jgi:OOP family OmpA-OmpF porin
LKKILVSKGAPNDRIKTDSKGDTDPIASNDTEQGRKDNRRVLMTPVK